jgi:DNA helicase-2/ATP-dependent DNA helicase PcrA
LIACAGAGKTETVSLRIVEQLKLPDIGPANVVAFMSTERAAELRTGSPSVPRRGFGTRESIADLFVETIHGFCLEMLQQFSFDLLSYGVLTDVQQRLFISRISRQSGLADLGWHRYYDARKCGELMSVLREA